MKNPDFHRLMQEATRLTREGRLGAATTAIRSALSPARTEGATADAGSTECIDVEAREIPDAEALPLTAPPPAGAATAEQAATTQTLAQPPAPASPEEFLSGRFGEGPSARGFRVYVPPLADARPRPLVVMLHGCTQDPADFAAGTAMNEAAREAGWFVLYPAQSAKANPHKCWNWFKHTHQARGRGEPASIAALTQDIASRYPVDRARIYVAGLSAGGAMAAILAQEYPDIFAAAGIHSGLAAGAARDLPSALHAMKEGRSAPAKPTGAPVIVFHGDADATVHPRNGDHVFAGAGDASAEVRTESGRTPAGRAWTRRVKHGADGKVQAEHWQVRGGPHAWSGGSARGSYTDPQGPDATKEMLRFFAEHSLRGA